MVSMCTRHAWLMPQVCGEHADEMTKLGVDNDPAGHCLFCVTLAYAVHILCVYE